MAEPDINQSAIVIIGNGSLGRAIFTFLSQKGRLVSILSKEDLDITKIEDVRRKIHYPYGLVINCTGYTQVDLAETKRAECYAVNALGVNNLVTVCNNHASLIYFSTDYVFDGNQESYDETAARSPVNWYGRTKANGEDVITSMLEKFWIIRTSWLFGGHRKNFVDTILRLAQERSEIRVVNDQFGKPTFVKDLAERVIDVTARHPGVYHLTNEGVCSWYDLAKETVRLAGLSTRVVPCITDEFPLLARRPKRSVLNNTKLPRLRHWREALEEYISNRGETL